MTMVFDRYPAGGNERLLALALADHARDDGTSIWPSIDELSRKTLQSRSTVQRQIAKMVQKGWLILLSDRTGRGHTNEYRIDPAWIAGDPSAGSKPLALVPAPTRSYPQGCQSDTLSKRRKGVIQDVKGVTTDVKRVIAVTPESSEPSEPNTPLPPGGGAAGFERVFDTFPNPANRAKAHRRWLRIAPDAGLQAVMLRAIAAQRTTAKWRKEGGRFIPEFATWLRNRCWLDRVGGVMAEWWLDGDGIKAMGQRAGLPFSLAELGNAYTDDQRMAHWRRYRARVFAAAGDGPWSERRAA